MIEESTKGRWGGYGDCDCDNREQGKGVVYDVKKKNHLGVKKGKLDVLRLSF